MSSSRSEPPRPYEASVVQNELPIGPVRLPVVGADQFIETFNRIYAGQRMTLLANPAAAAKPTELKDPVK